MPKTPPPADEPDADDFLSLGEDAPKDVVKMSEEHPILTPEEVAAAKLKARQKIDRERRASALKLVEDQELLRLRIEEGLTTGVDTEDLQVWITIDLPDWSPNVAVNGMPYWHGHSYQVPKHVYRTLAEQIQNAWRANDLSEGKSLAQQFQKRRDTAINGRTGIADNAPRRFDAVH